MMKLKTIAAGAAIAGSLGFAALGVGTGVANAAPSPVGSGTQWALDPGWGHGGGPGWNGGGRGGGDWNRGGWNGGGPRWAPPPPPPPPYYGYGGYNDYNGYGGGCVTGPLGLLHFCN